MSRIAASEVFMSQDKAFPNPFGFLMPGLDAMRQWSGMASTPATPPGWVAPTMSVEDLDKRIQELKTVQYWLEQNARMIGATVQALEVQKMTLSTLKSMNVHADELAKALRVQPQDLMAAWAPKATAAPAVEPTPEPPEDLPREEPFDAPPEAAEAPAQAGVDPVQWWGALNEQFQTIASSAARDWQHHAQRAQAQMAAAQNQATSVGSAKSAADATSSKPQSARKTASRKTAARKSTGATRGSGRSARKS